MAHCIAGFLIIPKDFFFSFLLNCFVFLHGSLQPSNTTLDVSSSIRSSIKSSSTEFLIQIALDPFTPERAQANKTDLQFILKFISLQMFKNKKHYVFDGVI